MAASRKPNELYITRVFDAPVKLVWDAWTDPEQVGQWWGPRGFTLTTHGRDLRPGGQWIYTMHGPDGTDYPNVTTYHEVERHARLVYDHGATESTPPLFRVTVSFREVRGKTHMDMTMTLATPEAAQEIRKLIKQAGGDSTWDRLAEYLYEIAGQDKFVINRTFAAPIDLVFEMWAAPRHLARWLPPVGTELERFEGEIRTGASAFWCMAGGSRKLYGRFDYVEVSRPDRLVYTQTFCDENGNTSRFPVSTDWPESMKNTVLLSAEDADTTRVTLISEVVGSPTEAERTTFHGAKSSMTQGWTGSFDKLDERLAELASRSRDPAPGPSARGQHEGQHGQQHGGVG